MLAVTVLTSLAESDLHDMGIKGSPREQVLRLAALARANGMQGVVCSAHEIEALRAEMGDEFKLIVPGIRPAGSDAHDQKRVMTPEQAQSAGADILVIGRAITEADNIAAAAQAIKGQFDRSARWWLMGAPGIKICGVTRRGDIEAMNRLGVDLVGFNFVEKSPRYVTQDNAAALAAHCRADMERVALLVDADDDAIDRAFGGGQPTSFAITRP